MTALLLPGEALTLGLNVIVRPGDPAPCPYDSDGQGNCAICVRDKTIHGFVAPPDWVALTGPCPTCKGTGKIIHPEYHTTRNVSTVPCPDCRDGRRIVPLYTGCPNIVGWNDLTAIVDGTKRVLVGRGSIEVVPVVAGRKRTERDAIQVRGDVWLVRNDVLERPLDINPYPRRIGQDFGIVIDCVEVTSNEVVAS